MAALGITEEQRQELLKSITAIAKTHSSQAAWSSAPVSKRCHFYKAGP